MSASVRAGNLTRYVQVQQRALTQDSFGQEVLTWTTIKSIYAGIAPVSGKELFTADSMNTSITHTITVRYDSALWSDPKTAAGYRILYGTRIYDISAVLNMDEANRLVTLSAVEGLTAG